MADFCGDGKSSGLLITFSASTLECIQFHIYHSVSKKIITDRREQLT